MSLRLPVVSRSILPAGQSPAETREDLLRRLRDPSFKHGYIRADVGDRALLLFVHQRATYCAGVLDHGRAIAITVQEFVDRLHAATQISICATDLPLFLCTAVLVRKAPATQILGSEVRDKQLLKQIKQIGKDAVLVVRRGDARSMVFCHGGTPVKLYPAKGERFPERKRLSERIVGYVQHEDAESAIIDLYGQINVGPSADAGQSLDDVTLDESDSGRNTPVNPVLAVKLGDRVVFHYVLREDEARVGRGLNNDIELDNPSVSRNHAVIHKQGHRVVVDDLGSQNGIFQRAKRVVRTELLPGDEVAIGKYRLAYLADPPDMYVRSQPSGMRSPLSAMDQTFSVTSSMPKLVTTTGEAFPVRGLSFMIGTGADADIRIVGLGIAAVHVRIQRTPIGLYIAQHVSGSIPLVVNGTSVGEVLLQEKDVIEVGEHVFRFVTTG